MNIVDLDQPVAQVLQAQPELLDLLVDLGFKPLANPVLLQSAGRITSLRQGCRLIGLDLDKLKQELRYNGYQVKGEIADD